MNRLVNHDDRELLVCIKVATLLDDTLTAGKCRSGAKETKDGKWQRKEIRNGTRTAKLLCFGSRTDGGGREGVRDRGRGAVESNRGQRDQGQGCEWSF